MIAPFSFRRLFENRERISFNNFALPTNTYYIRLDKSVIIIIATTVFTILRIFAANRKRITKAGRRIFLKVAPALCQ